MVMKILKGAARSQVLWTTRKLVQMFKDGEVNFDIDIQRGYVWKDNDKRSALIRSLILDRPVPPLYFNKIEDAFEGEDGKQRTLTIIKFLQDEFELSGLEAFKVINDDGELEELDMNGLKYSELPDCFQDAIKDYGFTIEFTDNASQEEVADNFYNLNNGNKYQSIYYAMCGKNYEDKLMMFITDYGFINVEYHIYIDNDIQNYIIDNLRRISRTLKINVYIHQNRYNGEKDFGVKRSKIHDYVYIL